MLSEQLTLAIVLVVCTALALLVPFIFWLMETKSPDPTVNSNVNSSSEGSSSK